MAKGGLDKWFAQKWVDIGSKKKDGSFSKCGRSGGLISNSRRAGAAVRGFDFKGVF